MSFKPWRGFSALSGPYDSIFGGHSLNFDTIQDRVWCDRTSRVKCPICNTLCFTKSSDIFICFLVSTLLFSSGPSAIVRRVSFPSTLSIKLKMFFISRRFCPFTKVIKISPFTVNCNTFVTIKMVSIMIRICATLNHSVPNSIKAFSFSYSIVSMLRVCISDLFSRLASTRSRVAEQFERSYKLLSATITSARIQQNIVLLPAAAFPEDLLCVRPGYSPIAKASAYGDIFGTHTALLLKECTLACQDVTGNRTSVTTDLT